MRLRFRDKTPSSRLERRFLLYWQSLGSPEIEGGIYIAGGGRHNRAAGFVADLEKYLEAALAGWRVVRLAEPLITAPMVERLIAFVRGGGVK